MGVTVSVANGLPLVTGPIDPAKAVALLSGTLLDYFDFTYNVAQNQYSGTQKATIPGFCPLRLVSRMRLR